jgi:streptomycin 6-kinase
VPPPDWTAALPEKVAWISDEWDLTIGAQLPGGENSWVALVGDDQVLKVGWLHDEALHEAEGLRLYDGDGAVGVHRAAVFDDTSCLLLERLGAPLSSLPEEEQDVVLAGLLRRLWRPGEQPFRPLWQMCAMWVDGMKDSPLDPGLVRHGKQLFVELAAGETLLLTDLHAGNVLAGSREPWLAIDPKPYVGDRHYDVLQHLLNCRERLAADPAGLVRRMAGLLELDFERVLLWLFARCVIESGSDPQLATLAEVLAP